VLLFSRREMTRDNINHFFGYCKRHGGAQ